MAQKDWNGGQGNREPLLILTHSTIYPSFQDLLEILDICFFFLFVETFPISKLFPWKIASNRYILSIEDDVHNEALSLKKK